VATMLIKAIVVYFLMRQRKSNKSDAVKSALALCQIGEFSFAVFALANSDGIISDNLAKFLILVTVLSMIITPFIVNNIYKIASYFVVEFYESDKITPIDRKNHAIICGYSMLGRIIAKQLDERKQSFVIISDNLKHVLLARKQGYMAYFGHLEKLPVLESLKVDEASSVIITLNGESSKRLICEAVLNFKDDVNLIVRIDSLDEKRALRDLKIKHYVHSQLETANLMVEKALVDPASI
ncbi:MAG: NAD-binding protein, partial [Sulfurimonas sp.]